MVLYGLSVILQPYNGGDFWFKVINFEVSLAALTSQFFYKKLMNPCYR